MDTEASFDKITVSGESSTVHSGRENWQVAVSGSKAFTWHTDRSVVRGGFKLCCVAAST